MPICVWNVMASYQFMQDETHWSLSCALEDLDPTLTLPSFSSWLAWHLNLHCTARQFTFPPLPCIVSTSASALAWLAGLLHSTAMHWVEPLHILQPAHCKHALGCAQLRSQMGRKKTVLLLRGFESFDLNGQSAKWFYICKLSAVARPLCYTFAPLKNTANNALVCVTHVTHQHFWFLSTISGAIVVWYIQCFACIK